MMVKTPLPTDKPQSGCCFGDPYADLPSELRPKNRSWRAGFRQVTCPGCGLEYWTNTEGNLCMDCQKKSTPVPPKDPKK